MKFLEGMGFSDLVNAKGAYKIKYAGMYIVFLKEKINQQFYSMLSILAP